MLVIRAAKVALVAAVALFATLVAFGNMTDYETNFMFVQHVLMMDTLFPVSTIKYRAIMLVAILAKASYGIAGFMLYSAGRIPLVVLLGGTIDLVWVVLFAIAYGKTPERES